MLILMLLCSGLWILLGFVSFGLIVVSPMMFDAPGSDKIRALWVIFYGLWLFPVMIVLSLIAAWGLYLRMDDSRAVYVLLLPLVNVLVVVGGFVTLSAGREDAPTE